MGHQRKVQSPGSLQDRLAKRRMANKTMLASRRRADIAVDGAAASSTVDGNKKRESSKN